jgi:hypothetical protein
MQCGHGIPSEGGIIPGTCKNKALQGHCLGQALLLGTLIYKDITCKNHTSISLRKLPIGYNGNFLKREVRRFVWGNVSSWSRLYIHSTGVHTLFFKMPSRFCRTASP